MDILPGVRHQRDALRPVGHSPFFTQRLARHAKANAPQGAVGAALAVRWGLWLFMRASPPPLDCYPCRVRPALFVDLEPTPAGLGDAVDQLRAGLEDRP